MVISAVLGLVFSVYSYVLLFFYSPFLALVATGLIATALAATVLASYREVPYQREIQRLQGELTGTVRAVLLGIGKLRVAGAETRGYVRWVRQFSQQRRFLDPGAHRRQPADDLQQRLPGSSRRW